MKKKQLLADEIESIGEMNRINADTNSEVICKAIMDGTLHPKDLEQFQQIANKTIHLFFHIKGGVAKTLICSKMAELLIRLGYDPLVVDLDSFNDVHKISRYKALRILKLNIFDNKRKVIPTIFDHLLDAIDAENQPVLIDLGASTYQDFMDYAKVMNMVADLQDQGFEVICHVPILPGDYGVSGSIKALELAHTTFPTLKFYCWMNRFGAPAKEEGQIDKAFWGEPTEEYPDGEPFFKNKLMISPSKFHDVWIGTGYIPDLDLIYKKDHLTQKSKGVLSMELATQEVQIKLKTTGREAKRVEVFSFPFFAGVVNLLKDLIFPVNHSA